MPAIRKSFHQLLSTITLALVLWGLAPTLVAQSDVGFLRTRVKPAVAGVFVDGKYHGTAAIFKGSKSGIRLSPGQHKVEIVEPRYKTLQATVNIETGKTTTLREDLTPVPAAQPPFGLLKIKKGKRAAVYLNGAYYGQADEFNGPGQGLLLNPGEYNLKVVPLSGGSTKEKKIKIAAGKTTAIRMP
jgi:hypothetical protein